MICLRPSLVTASHGRRVPVPIRFFFMYVPHRANMRKQAQDDSLSAQPVCAAQTDIPLYSSVFSMKLIPPLPQRERTHVTTPRRDTRSSP